ncbi:MAG: GNAT family N-acetyltransferase [Caulobacteraceae bacterium]|nr:GNAT family N-acetyltransferase [Caulobacteraceae bacterium]
MDFEAMRRGAETPQIAGRGQIAAVANDLAAAFEPDPDFAWFSRPDERRDTARAGFFRFALRRMRRAGGEILRPATGGAAAVWIASERIAPTPLLTELTGLPTLLALTGWGRFGRLTQMRDAMAKHHPHDRPHDYLYFLGVTPEAQGHGIGSRLLKSRLAQLDAAGRPAFLETATEANVRLYGRHGFTVIAEFRPGASGPTNWSMWREPQVA